MHTYQNPAAESVAALLRLVSAATLREVPKPLTVRSYSCGACGLVRQARGECERCS
jgi:hypothetical protein